MSLHLVPLTLSEANRLVREFHRHHKPVVGHKFSIGLERDGELIGAVVVGRPVARMTDHKYVAEITRLVVTPDQPNACSCLYAAAARAAKAMGYQRIQTFILASEPGTSLKAAGWQRDGSSPGGDWETQTRKGQLDFAGRIRRADQPMGPKQRWVRNLSS